MIATQEATEGRPASMMREVARGGSFEGGKCNKSWWCGCVNMEYDSADLSSTEVRSASVRKITHILGGHTVHDYNNQHQNGNV